MWRTSTKAINAITEKHTTEDLIALFNRITLPSARSRRSLKWLRTLLWSGGSFTPRIRKRGMKTHSGSASDYDAAPGGSPSSDVVPAQVRRAKPGDLWKTSRIF